jgi:hypothetical protein
MSEDTPLYGEQSQGTKIFLYVIQGILGFFALFSMIVGIVFGIKREGQHIMLVFVVLDLCVLTFLFFRWYSNDSIDPKYRWLIVGFALTLLWTCITLNAYAWHNKVDPSSKCGAGNGYYSFAQKSCITMDSGQNIGACVGIGYCMCLTGHTPGAKNVPESWSAVCRNCTANPCVGLFHV